MTLLGIVAVVIIAFAMLLDDPASHRATRAFVFFVLSVPPLLLALLAWLRALRHAAARASGRWVYGTVLFLALVPERLVRGSASDLAGPALYVAGALLLTADRPRDARALWRDLPLVLLLWIPLELRWIPGEWTLLRLLGLDLLLLLYVVERPVCEPGRLVVARSRELAWGAGYWIVFLAIAIPVAIGTGFASPGVSDRSSTEWIAFVLLTFWTIALPEEALFRGAIQGLLEKALGNPWWALALASVVFGLSHLNNRNGDAPDWRYVLLATIAGLAYGLAYIKTRNLAAPILTHALVDVTWRGFFAGPH